MLLLSGNRVILNLDVLADALFTTSTSRSVLGI